MGSSEIPIGWTDSPRRGYLIEDLFIPMKTILDGRYSSSLTNKTIFDMNFIRDLANSDGIVLLIDLIDSEKYYKSEDMKDLLQIKISIPGKDSLPTSKQIKAFIKIVNKNIELDPGGKIGVHCTHGFNKTGFMIVNYLVTQRGLTLNEALEKFAKARPPGIYKTEYLKHLVNLFQPNLPISYPAPPNWVHEKSKKQEKEALKESVAELKRPETETRREQLPKMIVEDVPTEVPLDLLPTEFSKPSEVCEISKSEHIHSAYNKKRKSELLADSIETGSLKKRRIREEVASPYIKTQTSEYGEKSRKKSDRFKFLIPMCPKADRSVSRLKEELQSILQTTLYGFVGHKYKLMTEKVYNRYLKREFFHTWRTDGKRFLLFILGENQIYMINEANKYYKIDNLHFRHPYREGKHLTGTILDGELVADVIFSSTYHQYLISDIYALGGNRINQPSYTLRLNMIQEFIMDLRKETDFFKSEKEPFNIIMKTISERKRLIKTWNVIKKSLTHKMTGLIFYPYNDISYTFLGRASIYIWIPLFYRFIKFKLKAVIDKHTSQWIGLLFTYGDLSPYSKIKYITDEEKRKYNGKIVRCYLNRSNFWKIGSFDPEDKVPISKWDVYEQEKDWRRPINFQELL